MGYTIVVALPDVIRHGIQGLQTLAGRITVTLMASMPIYVNICAEIVSRRQIVGGLHTIHGTPRHCYGRD